MTEVIAQGWPARKVWEPQFRRQVRPESFFYCLPKCCSLSEDIQQSCWQSLL